MDSISSNILEHLGGSTSSGRTPTTPPDVLQELNQYDFAGRSPFQPDDGMAIPSGH
jgi:hypothetical protein